MEKKQNPKTGDQVEQTGYYTDEWMIVEPFEKGDTFPADPIMGDTHWKLLHYPFDSQTTSKFLPKKYWNKIEDNQDEDA